MIGILVSVGILLIIKFLTSGLKDLSPASLRYYIQSFGKFGVIVYMLFYVLDTLVLFPPMSGVAVAAGIAFGPFWGFIYLMIAAMIGTHIAFLLARVFCRRLVEKAIQKRFKNIDDALEKNGFRAVLFFRIIPIVPYEILNYASGLSKIKLKDFAIATFIGLMPGILISVYFGDSLASVRKAKDIFSPKLILASVLLIIIVASPIVYRYIKKKNRFIRRKKQADK